jgi:predicted flap endonuclease-1-like 5' DNA nuclease
MMYLAQTYWLFLILGLLLGLGIGWFTWKRDGSGSGLVYWGLLIAGLAVLALLQLVPQRVGFWLDLGILMLITYFLGCFLGGYSRYTSATHETSTITDAPEQVALAEPVTDVDSPVFEGAKPAGLAAPRGGGKADDLKRIKGIGKQNEGRLHGLGIWHFDQIAAWTDDEVRWVGHFLAFPGRIEREEWVAQAKVLAAGGETEFSKRADAGEVATSRDDTGDDGQGNVIPVTKGQG